MSRPPGKRPAGSAPLKRRRPPPPPPPKKKGPNLLPLVLGSTLVGILGLFIWVGILMAEKVVPSTPVDQTDPGSVRRPKVEDKFETKPLTRPGLLVMAPDQIYYPKATDVRGQPIEPVVNGLLERGTVTVFTDGTFRGGEPIPRAEFALWCYNAMMAQTGKTADPFVSPKKALRTVEGVGGEFEDVDGDHWAVSLLATLKAAHYFGETSPKEFRPDAPLRREEWALHSVQWLASRQQLLNLNRQVDPTKLAVAMRKLNYTDSTAIRGVYKPFVYFILSDEKRSMWLQGTFEAPVNPGPWHPNKPVTRGEAAIFIGGFYDEVGRAFM